MTRSKQIAIAVFWLVVAIFTFAFFPVHTLSGDEGVVLNAAWQIWSGQTMYQTFVWYTPPGTAELVVVLWKIIGQPSYVITKLFFTALVFVSAGAVWQITKRVSEHPAAPFLAVLFWLTTARFYPLINHNTLSSLAVIAVTWFFLLYLQKPKRSTAIALGIGVAATCCILQTKGLALLAFVVLFMLWQKTNRKDVLLFLIAAILPTLLYFLRWPPNLIIDSLFILPNTSYWGPNSYLHSPLVLVLEAGAIGLMFWYAHSVKKKELYFLSFLQLVLWISSANIVNIPHAFINAFPLCVVAADYFSSVRLTRVRPRELFLKISPLAILLISIIHIWWMSFQIWPQTIYQIDLQNQPFSIVEKINRLNLRPFYAGHFLPGLYFEAREPNPYPYAELTTCSPACFVAMTKKIKEEKPAYAILNYSTIAKYRYPMDNPLETYLNEAYIDCGAIPGEHFHLRARDACPTY